MEGEQHFPYSVDELLSDSEALLELDLHLDFTPGHQLCELLDQDNALVDSLPTSELCSIEEDILTQSQDENHSQESNVHINISHNPNGAGEVHNCESTSANVDYGLVLSCNGSAEYDGLRLVHLLLACAEAMSVTANDLVDVILCRLGELVSPTGSTIERVAYYLFRFLEHLHHHTEGNLLGSNELCYSISRDPNFLGALILLNQVYPYIRIAHFTANQSILEAMAADSRSQNVHIIDFDIMEGMQWPPLMEALKTENYEISHLKITAIKWPDEEEEEADLPACSIRWNDTGRRLCEFATSLGIPFSFEKTEMKNVKEMSRHNEDELVMVNCMWELPHMFERTKKRLVEFLRGVRCLRPAVLCIGSGIETRENVNFMERFHECLRNMCSVFDSVEAGLPNEYGLARAMVERLFMGPMLCRSFNSLSTHEDTDFVRVIDIPVKCGFAEGEISRKCMTYANCLVSSSYAQGRYEIESVGKHGLLLKWNSVALTTICSWTAPH